MQEDLVMDCAAKTYPWSEFDLNSDLEEYTNPNPNILVQQDRIEARRGEDRRG